MAQKYNILPRKLKKEDIALAPKGWIRTLSNYPNYRAKAIKESKPGYYTLLATILMAIAKHNKHLIDPAIELTKNNMPRHIYLSLVGTALCVFGLKEEGLKMLRDAIKSHSTPALLMSLAAETDDLEEKACLAMKVLKEIPKDRDALRHLAYAKYFKGEQEEAESLIEKILLIDPCNIYALKFKGNIYFDKDDYGKALEQYLKIKLKITPISLQLKICSCYHLLGIAGKAKRIAKKIQGRVSEAHDLELDLENAKQLLTEILNN